MRVSTPELYRQGISAILDNQAKMLKTELQLASGKQILTPSDDPTGAVQSLQIESSLATTEQYDKNTLLLESRLDLEETILENVTDNIQRVRELAVQANNDSNGPEARAGIAAEIRQRLDELLSLANTRDANGEYIFAGFRSDNRPFSPDGAGNFPYAGDAGQRFIQISPVRQVAIGDSGEAVFRSIPNGNATFVTGDNPANTGTGVIDPGSVTDPTLWVADNYTISFTTASGYEVRDGGGALVTNGVYQAGAAISFLGVQTTITGAPQAGDSFTLDPSANQDLFTTYQDLVTALETPTATAADVAQFHNAMNRALTDIDQGLDHILTVRASIGGRQNAVETQKTINEDTTLQLQTTLSAIQDLDYAEAISLFQQQLTALQAAQQAYVQVQGLSLFQFLR